MKLRTLVFSALLAILSSLWAAPCELSRDDKEAKAPDSETARGLKFEIRLKPFTSSDGKRREVDGNALDRAAEAIRMRAKADLMAKPLIRPQAPDRLLVEIPEGTVGSMGRWEGIFTHPGKIEFRKVHPDSEEFLAKLKAGEADFDPIYEIVNLIQKRKGKFSTQKLIVFKKAEISGDKVASVRSVVSDYDGWDIEITLGEEGRRQFAAVTREMAKSEKTERFAILVSDVALMAAGLSDEAKAAGGISGPTVMLAAGLEEAEARRLVALLLNPLEHPAEIVTKSVQK